MFEPRSQPQICSVKCGRFHSKRVVNIWNSLPASADFTPLSSFKRIVKLVDFSKFLKCLKCS